MKHADILKAHTDPRISAKLARVRYQPDDIPGWTRTRHGRNAFVYKNQKGAVLKKKDIERIEALRIPPAWKGVWISPYPKGHIQVTGIDAKGRKQYLYHANWSAFRESLKFSRLAAFAEVLPKLRRAIKKGLTEDEPTRTKVSAAALELIDELAIRIGSDSYAKENKTYGVTTLQNRHISIEGDHITLHFTGKSHQDHELELHDKKLAKILKEERAMTGSRLFQYEDGEGHRHPLTASDVNTFIQQATEGDFTAKDFRTWIGTVYAYECMSKVCSGNDSDVWQEKEYQKSLRSVIKDVAEKLGNTAAVTKAHYIHADLQEQYCAGTFKPLLRKIHKMRHPNGLYVKEGEVASLLTLFAKEKSKR